MGTLFVVATPIGNLGDLSRRALETFQTCDRVVAEDTRRTRQLLTHFGITGKPVDRLDAHASERDIARLLEALRAGERVALVTDAGTPGVSDPGGAAVRAAIEAGVLVVPIPGPSAVLAALVASGVAGGGSFRFLGFLPRSGPERHRALTLVAETPEAVVLFESPARTRETLRDLAGATPDRAACVARELTKVHEELVRAPLHALAEDEREWRGEVVIVLGAHVPEDRTALADDASIDARIDEGLARGEHAKEIAERLAAWSGRPRRDLYARVVSRRALRGR